MRRSDSWALDEQAREQAEAGAAAAPPSAPRRSSEPACSRGHASDLYVRVGENLLEFRAVWRAEKKWVVCLLACLFRQFVCARRGVWPRCVLCWHQFAWGKAVCQLSFTCLR